MVRLRHAWYVALSWALSLLPPRESLTCWNDYTHDFTIDTCVVFISVDPDERWRLRNQALANEQCRMLGESDWSLLTLDSSEKHEALFEIVRNTMGNTSFFYAQWLDIVRLTEDEWNWTKPEMWIWSNGQKLEDSFDGPVPWAPSEPDNNGYVVDQNQSAADMERCVVAKIMRTSESSPWFEWFHVVCDDNVTRNQNNVTVNMEEAGVLTCQGKKLHPPPPDEDETLNDWSVWEHGKFIIVGLFLPLTVILIALIPPAGYYGLDYHKGARQELKDEWDSIYRDESSLSDASDASSEKSDTSGIVNLKDKAPVADSKNSDAQVATGVLKEGAEKK